MHAGAIRLAGLTMAITTGLGGFSWAQTVDPTKAAWIGVKVLPKENYVVKVGNEIIGSYDKPVLRLPWVVQDVNGPWLLVGGSLKGWVQRNQVVTLNEAHAYYTDLILQSPGNYWAYNLRGLMWQERGELDLAIADFNEELRLAPTAVGYDNRGNAWQVKKEFDKAIADYDQAAQLDPTYVLAYVGRGAAWRAKKEYSKAIADYNHALRVNPRYARAYNGRGLAWQAMKQFDRAMADYGQAIKIDPNYTTACRDMAWLMATCTDASHRDGKRALEYATKACELSGWTNGSYLDALACAYAETRDFNSAGNYERRAINLNPSDAEFVAAAKNRLELFSRGNPYRE